MESETNTSMNLKALTITQAMSETGLSRSTLYRLRDEGKVGGNYVGVRYYFSAESLHAWLNQKVEPAAKLEPPIADPDNPFL